MRWFRHHYGQYTLCLSTTGPDPDYYSGRESFRIYQDGKRVFTLHNAELFNCYHLRDYLDHFLSGTEKEGYTESPVFSLIPQDDPVYRMKMLVRPGTIRIEDDGSCYDCCGEPYTFCFTLEDLQHLQLYLQMIIGNKGRKGTEIRKLYEQDILYDTYRWCVIGNIIETREDPETHEIYHGTPAYSPRTKVYISLLNDDGSVWLIGRNRKGRRLTEKCLPLSWVTNLRVQKIYDPHVLDTMDRLGWLYLTDSKEDQKKAEEFLAELIKRKENTQ